MYGILNKYALAVMSRDRDGYASISTLRSSTADGSGSMAECLIPGNAITCNRNVE